jgi:regulator of cell morphogenesis and NO signaling
MVDGRLYTALEREHREIDAGIEAYTSGRVGATASTDSLTTEAVTTEAVTTEVLTTAIGALRRHIYLEEEFLFPPLRAAGMMAPVFVMLREHGELWQTLDLLEAELGGGSERGGDREAVLTRCAELTAQLAAHNAKEEPILYAQADAVLTDAAAAELTSFLDRSGLPDQWVCERARRPQSAAEH